MIALVVLVRVGRTSVEVPMWVAIPLGAFLGLALLTVLFGIVALVFDGR